jgi:excisionase family DNA binding protein
MSMGNIIKELDECLTTDEVQAYLGITSRTMYRMIRAGELPAIRVGRQWRFRRSDMDRWLERRAPLAVSGNPPDQHP